MKNKIQLLLALCFMISMPLWSQMNNNLELPTSINEDGNAPDGSAVLDVQSTTKGMLAPRLTTVQRTAITTPATGLLVYDTDTGSFWYFENNSWLEIGTTTATQLIDADGDTRVTVESLPDEDVVRLSAGGGTAGLEVRPNSSVFNGPLRVKGTFVGGATSNSDPGQLSFVGGGEGNSAPGFYCFVGGGENNTATEMNSVVVGGVSNTVNSESFVGGGYLNKAMILSVVVGGAGNTASNSSFVGGGEENTASDYSFVGVGSYNTASGGGVIGGGGLNTASGGSSFVGAGGENTASNNWSVVVGGYQNVASGNSSFVGGGFQSVSSGVLSFVGCGLYNESSGRASFVGSGDDNTASGDYSFVGGGRENAASGWSSFVGGTSLLAKSYAETVFGAYNTDYMPVGIDNFNVADRLFVIGNGTAGNRSNAVTVMKSGNVGIGTSLPEQTLHVNGGLKIANTTTTASGSLRFDGTNFQGYDGTSWNNLDDSCASVWSTNATKAYYDSGNVGIGTNNPTSTLHVQGDIAVSGFIVHPSDGRLKENIKDLRNGLSIINQLLPKTYTHKLEMADAFGLSSRLQYGLIAQEVKSVLPELVVNVALIGEDETEYMGVDYDKLIPILVQAVKELSIENEYLNAANEKLVLENKKHATATSKLSEKVNTLMKFMESQQSE